MSARFLSLFLLVFLASTAQTREYRFDRALPADQFTAPGKITLTLYANAEGGEPLETHSLPTGQWRLDDGNAQASHLTGIIDSDMPLPLWAEIRIDGELLDGRSALNAPGDLSAAGEIYSRSGGFRFPDNTVQASAANTEAQAKVFGGSSSCPTGSSIRAIDAAGNVTCETDDVGGGITRVDTGAGLAGGPITTSGTISVAAGGIESTMIAAGAVGSPQIASGAVGSDEIASNAVGSAQIDASQVQRRVSGACPTGYLMTGINADGSLQCTGVHVLVPRRLATVTVDSAGFVGSHTSLALDASGHPVISYYDGTNNYLKLAHCNDAHCASASITIVDSSGNTGWYTSLVLDASGHPVISYYDATYNALKLAHCNDANCASTSISAVDSTGNVGAYTSLALDTSGHPVISYYDVTNGDLKLAHCNDANCASVTLTTVDSAGSVGSDTSLALDASGHPVISYYDATNGDLKLAHCNDANCVGGDEVITTVDSAGNVGRNSSLVLDARGYPVISYYDWANDVLKLAHCNDANCAGGNEAITTLDSTGDVGQYNSLASLALDANGHPVISYYDATNDDLKLAHCNDADCTGNDESITTVDSAGNVGWYNSLTLDASGQPVISYYDVTNGDLKLAR